MDLWIRSQDKMQLTEIQNVYVEENDDDYMICCNDFPCLGKYKTRERALEILDEIQKLIMGQNKLVFKNCDIDIDTWKQIKEQDAFVINNFDKRDIDAKYISPSTIVYEMPLN